MNFIAISNRFVGEIPFRSNRVVRAHENDDWCISLGMHNFRRALKVEGSKSRLDEREDLIKVVGKRTHSRIERRILRRGRVAALNKGRRSRRNKRRRLLKYMRTDRRRYYRLLGRWERSAYKEVVSVRGKSKKAKGSFDEESHRLRGALRGVAIRRTGQYWRNIRRMKNEIPTPSVAVKLASDRKLRRDSSRKRWLYTHSWLKLPKGYLSKTIDTFAKYCVRCKILGHFTAFYLISHWLDPEAKRVKKLYDKPTVYTIYNGLDLFREWNPDGKTRNIPREPHRSDYVNYKSWMSAYEHFFSLIDMAKAGRILDRGVLCCYDIDKLNSFHKKA